MNEALPPRDHDLLIRIDERTQTLAADMREVKDSALVAQVDYDKRLKMLEGWDLTRRAPVWEQAVREWSEWKVVWKRDEAAREKSMRMWLLGAGVIGSLMATLLGSLVRALFGVG